jgi:Helicase associated domain
MPLAVALKQSFHHSGGTNTMRALAVANHPWGKSNTDRWERGFAALSKFRAREGHCRPSRHHVEGGFRLGQWVSIQRYHKDKVPAERKWRLDKIGFVWDWRDDLWEQNFAALLKFKRRKGHCCVPIIYKEGDLKLGWWVATQRRTRKEMSAERRARLNKIGFVWHAPRPYRPTEASRRISAPDLPQPRA